MYSHHITALRPALPKEPFRLKKSSASKVTLSGVSSGTHKRAGVHSTRPSRSAWTHFLHPSLAAPRGHGQKLSPVMSENALLITLDDAASRLAVCRRTLEREIAAGRFPRPVRIGRTTRIQLSDLQAYLQKLVGPIPAK